MTHPCLFMPVFDSKPQKKNIQAQKDASKRLPPEKMANGSPSLWDQFIAQNGPKPQAKSSKQVVQTKPKETTKVSSSKGPKNAIELDGGYE